MCSCDILTSFSVEWAAAHTLGGYCIRHSWQLIESSVEECRDVGHLRAMRCGGDHVWHMWSASTTVPRASFLMSDAENNRRTLKGLSWTELQAGCQYERALFEYHMGDSQCAVHTLLPSVTRDPPVHAVLGPTASRDSQIGYGASTYRRGKRSCCGRPAGILSTSCHQRNATRGLFVSCDSLPQLHVLPLLVEGGRTINI